MPLTAQEERCHQQPKAKDARTEVMPWSCDNTQISRNRLIYKREKELASKTTKPLAEQLQLIISLRLIIS